MYVKNNQIIAKFDDVEDVLDFASENLEIMNVVNLATAAHRVGKLNSTRTRNEAGAPATATRHPAVVEDARFRALFEKLREYLVASQNGSPLGKGLGRFNARELSAILWGSAHCGITTSDDDPTVALVVRRIANLDDDDPPAQNVSNVLWAYATMHTSKKIDVELVQKCEYWCDLIMDDFAPQGISNSLWAFATLGYTLKPETIAKFSQAIRRQLKDFKSMEFSNVVWALATMKTHLDPLEVFDELLDEMHASIKAVPNMWSSQSVSNTLWAIATLDGEPHKLRARHGDYLNTLCMYVERKANTFVCQGLANTLWALATLEYTPSMKMLEAATARWSALATDVYISECSNLLWSYASLRFNPGNEVLTQVAELYLRVGQHDEVALTQVSNTLWAWANFGWLPEDPSIVECVLQVAIKHFKSDPDLQTQSLANILWSLATLRFVPGDEFLQAFRERALIELREDERFSDQGLCNTIWAYGQLGVNPGTELMSEIASQLGARVTNFPTQGVTNSILAFATLGFWPDEWVVDNYRAKIVEMYYSTTISDIDLTQFFQANYLFEKCSPYGPLVTDPQMIEDMLSAWKRGSSKVVISQFHREVSDTLTNMGVPHEIEYITEDGLFSLDIALKGKKLAIEVDGPSHFARNIQNRRMSGKRPDGTGTYNIRYHYLDTNGWTTVFIPWYDWKQVCDEESATRTTGRRAAFLAKTLYDDAGLTLMDVASDEDMSDSGMSGFHIRALADDDVSVAQDGSRLVIQGAESQRHPDGTFKPEMKSVGASVPKPPAPVRRTGYGMLEPSPSTPSTSSTPSTPSPPPPVVARVAGARVAARPPSRASPRARAPADAADAPPDDDDPSPARRSRKSLATQRGAGVRRRRPRAPPSVESD